MRLIYHADAEAELIEAAQYYERSVNTLGIQFLDEADLSVSMILEAPERWQILESDIRRYLMAHFPYAIYYRISLTTFAFLRSSITAVTQITGGIGCPKNNLTKGKSWICSFKNLRSKPTTSSFLSKIFVGR